MEKIVELLFRRKVSPAWIWIFALLWGGVHYGPSWISVSRKPADNSETELLVSIAKQCMSCGKCKFTFSADQAKLKTIDKAFSKAGGYSVRALKAIPVNKSEFETPKYSIGEFPVLVEPMENR